MQRNKRIVTFIMIIAFICSFIPVKNVQAIDNINIISSTSVTAQDAKSWAKSRGATDTFISLADLYWKYAPSNGSVNPAIAYVQAAKETGYGKFGGVIDASYHNPCGLKTTSGGDDYDPNAHHKFKNWDEGVQAHLDHLALYAGAAGYPRADSFDPRAFASIKGTAKTVIDLGKKWAPSSNYGTDIMNLYNSLTSSVQSRQALGNIDEPAVNQNVSSNIMTVSGWALNPSGIEKVKIYVNNVYKGDAQLGLSRPDVQSVYGDSYNSTSTSGFKLDVDISNLSTGNNSVKIEAIGKDGTKFTQSRNFVNKSKLKSLGVIDEPADGKVVTGNSMTVSGWAIAASGIKEVKIYVNGVLKKSVIPNKARPDIKSTFPSYPNAVTSGYSENIDITNAARGNITVKVEEVAKDGSIKVSERTVRHDKLESRGVIDEPADGKAVTGNSMTVSGWAIAASGIKEVKIYVNGVLKKSITPNKARPDIKNAFPGYPDAATSGYSENIDITNAAEGNITVKVEEVAKDGSIKISERTVRHDKLESRGVIDEPADGKAVTGNSMTVSGWAIAASGIKEVKIYVNGVLKKSITPNKARPDIKNAFPGYPNAATSGYSENIDITNAAEGNITVKVEEVARDGSIKVSQKTVKHDRSQALGVMDEPSQGSYIYGNSITVSGWAIAASGIKEVKIYVDGSLKKTVKPNQPRPDIKKAFPNYPNAATSGYNEKIAITSKGNKTIKIEAVANDGTVRSETKNIVVKTLDSLGIIDGPVNGTKVTGSTVNVSGWSISSSGVKEVKVYVNGKFKGSVTPNVKRTDVQKAYPQYRNIEKCGYSLDVNIDDIPRGNAIVRTEEISNDGTSITNSKTINISRKNPIGCIDSPANLENVTKDSICISGWASNDSKLTRVNVYLDNVYKSNARLGVYRPDVKMAYPNYRETRNSGYELTVNLSGLTPGTHTIRIEAISQDGTISCFTRDFYYKKNNNNNKLVVIDPGHNQGGDDGAYSYFGNKTYSETELNMQVAVKTEARLKEEGYNVVLTRNPLDFSKIPMNESLAYRANLANDLNADVFISIHQNSFTSESAHGTEVFYTTRSHDSGFPAHNSNKLSKSKNLAKNIVDSVCENTGFYNRGAKDQSLFVLRNTKMPAVLVECGFISNKNEAENLSTVDVQNEIARGITNGIKQNF